MRLTVIEERSLQRSRSWSLRVMPAFGLFSVQLTVQMNLRSKRLPVVLAAAGKYVMDASGLTEGKTYYLAVTGNNAGLSPDWTWTEQTWEFVYSTETSATGDVSAAVWAGIALIGCGVLLAVVYATKKMHGETV